MSTISAIKGSVGRGSGRREQAGIRLPKVAALIVAAAMITIGGFSAAPASAAPARRIVPVAGTGHYLVYGRYTAARTGPASVALYSRDSTGRTRSLGSIATATPTSIPATASGSVLVVPRDGSVNYRWNLATGIRSTIASSTAAAPGGYLTVGSNGKVGSNARQAVMLVTDAGATNIGIPFPNGENADGAFHLFSGSAGVTITDHNGHIRYIAFASPGEVRSLYTVNRGANVASLGCSAFTSTSVACLAFDEENTTLFGARLDGSHAFRFAPRCVGTPAALHAAIAWVGCRHRLSVVGSDGSTSTSTTPFGDARPVSAYGKVVLQSVNGTSLLAMTRATSKPILIATVG